MDEIANLIRVLAESFELPEGTIPTAAESYDRQQVEDAAAIQENEKPGEAEPPVEVAGNVGQGPADPDAVQQNANAPVSPEVAVHQTAPANTPEGVSAGERYEVKPLSVVRSEGVPASEAVRVLAAVASANLNERVQAASPEVPRSDTFDVQQVTPATTVVHAVPSSLPFDFGHAMATIDRDVDLPEIGSSSQPNENEKPGEAEPAVEVAGNAGQGPADPEAVQQNTNAPVSPEAAVHQPVPASTPEGVTAGERYEVKPLSVVRSEGVQASEAVRVYDGQRVLAAVASANLNERVQAASPEVPRADTFDVQQVTPATTVVHAVPSSLPFDFGHAMATIDRDVDLPEIGSSSQPNDIEIPDLFSADTSEAYTAASYSGESVVQNQRDVLS